MAKHFFIPVLIVILVVPILVSAAPSAGLKPTSFFYFLDTITENIDLFFTFDGEKKAKKALAYAEERLAEIEAVSHDNAPQAVEKAAKYYQKRLTTATDNAQSIESKEKAEKLLATVSESTARHQEVLAEVYNSVPDEAKAAIEKVSEASKEKQLQALQFLLERKENIAEQQNEEAGKTTAEISQATNQGSEEKRNEKENQKAKIDRESEPTVIISNKTETIKQKNNPENQNKERAEIENLKREIEELKQKQITQPAPVAAFSNSNAPKISSLPNGAVVELNEKGEIVRYIKQPDLQPTINTPPPAAPQPSVTPAPQITAQNNTQPSEENAPIQKLLITSVSISVERTSAKIAWETHKPTESKVFISGGALSSKVFASESGLSTKHIVNMTELAENTGYSYEIEAIANTADVIKKTGGIRTLPPPLPPKFISGPTPVIKLSERGTYYISRIDWVADKPSFANYTNYEFNDPQIEMSSKFIRQCTPWTSGLKARTTYTCEIIITDKDTGLQTKDSFIFTTGAGVLYVTKDDQDYRRAFTNTDALPLTIKKVTIAYRGGTSGTIAPGTVLKNFHTNVEYGGDSPNRFDLLIGDITVPKQGEQSITIDVLLDFKISGNTGGSIIIGRLFDTEMLWAKPDIDRSDIAILHNDGNTFNLK